MIAVVVCLEAKRLAFLIRTTPALFEVVYTLKDIGNWDVYLGWARDKAGIPVHWMSNQKKAGFFAVMDVVEQG